MHVSLNLILKNCEWAVCMHVYVERIPFWAWLILYYSVTCLYFVHAYCPIEWLLLMILNDTYWNFLACWLILSDMLIINPSSVWFYISDLNIWMRIYLRIYCALKLLLFSCYCICAYFELACGATYRYSIQHSQLYARILRIDA